MRTSKKASITAVAALGISLLGGMVAVPAQAAESSTSAVTAGCVVIQPGLDQAQASGQATCGFWYAVQAYEAFDFGYTGPLNGVMGPNSWKGVQRYLNALGSGPAVAVDGVPGPNTYRAIQRMINSREGSPKVTVDGVFGPRTISAWAWVLQRETRG